MRLTSPLLAIAAVGTLVALAACSSTGTPAPTDSSAAKSIYLANPLPAYPDWAEFDRCFREQTSDLGIKGTTSGPTGLALDNAFTIDRISQAITQKYDALLVVPIAPEQFNPLMQQAKDAGIVVGTVNTGDSTDIQDFTIGIDYATYGAAVAERIGEAGGERKLLIVTNGPGGVGDIMIDAIKSNLPDNVEVINVVYDNADAAQTADVVSRELTTHPDINTVWSWEGTAVAGISTAIKEKDLVGEVVGVVNDLTDQSIAGIQDGTIFGASKQDWCQMARDAVDLAAARIAGDDVPAVTDTGTIFVTKDNLDEFLQK